MGVSIRTGLLVIMASGTSTCGSAVATKPVLGESVTAQTLARSGNEALREGHFREADRLFDQAVAVIGSSYEDPTVIDDTGQKLVLAQAEARSGHFSTAAHLKAGIVQDRLELITRDQPYSDCAHEWWGRVCKVRK